MSDKSPAASGSDFDTIFETMGFRYNINPRLLKAIATVESSLNPQAVNPADPSYGLMQILCTGDGPMCENSFNVDPWPVERRRLTDDPRLNVQIGAQILDWNLATYGHPKGIAVYNAWSARHDPAEGPFRNDDYVNAVMQHFVRLGGGDERNGDARLP